MLSSEALDAIIFQLLLYIGIDYYYVTFRNILITSRFMMANKIWSYFSPTKYPKQILNLQIVY